jgi:hypothetical protein
MPRAMPRGLMIAHLSYLSQEMDEFPALKLDIDALYGWT